MGWGEITLYFYVPMFPWKDFFDGKDWENTKNTRRKGTDQENSKEQEGKNGGKKKKRFFTYVEVPILFLVSCFDL
jgi:hypothetical protein